MNKFLQQILFVIPIAVAIVVAPVALYVKHRNAEQPIGAYLTVETTQSPAFFSKPPPPGASMEEKNYLMPEPFAANPVFGMSPSISTAMDPTAWMQIFIYMMNSYGASSHAMGAMMQMMYQMMAIPMQMTMPMYSGSTMHPHQEILANPYFPMPNVMNPKEYEEWYKKQQPTLPQDK